MSILLDGRTLGQRIREKVRGRVEQMPAPPGLAVLLVGDDPASHLYVSLKRKACEETGIRFELFLYPSNEPEAILIAKVEELNARTDINGILVQLPLPSQDADRVIEAIHPNKDVDGFHRENMRALSEGRPGIAPALALGIMKLLDEAQQTTEKKATTAAIVGSALFAEPLRYLLQEQNIFAERVDPDDVRLEEKTRIADIVVVAVGHPGLLTGDMIKPGAVVIDVGTTRVGEKIVGDVDRASVEPICGALTPVPGGVGPMTVAMLLLNVLKATELQRLISFQPIRPPESPQR